MATDADIPLPVCEVRGEQVGTFVDNIIKITASQLSLEKQTQDDKHDELPTVEGENFLKSPSLVEDHCQANNDPHDVSKVIEEPDQSANEGLDTLLHITKLSDQPVELGAKEETCMEESQQNGEDGNREQCSAHSSVVTPETDNATGVAQLSKDTSSNHHGTNDSSTENIALTKEILQEHSLLREETEPRISGEELNVELKTTDDKSADEKPTQEDVSSNLTDKVTAEPEALENLTSVENNFNTAAEKVSQENCTSTESIISRETSNGDELQSKSDKNSSILEEEETAVQKEDMQTENPTESLHVAPKNIEVADLSQENSIGGLPEEQSRSVTLHGNTIEAQEATADADDGQKEILESSQPIVPRSHEEGSITEVLQEATSDHTNEKIIDEDKKCNEVLEDLSSGEAHYKVNNFSPDVSKSAENTDQTIEDGTDTLLLSPKLADQPVEFAANEETSAEEIQQNVAESDSTEKDVAPEQCSKDSSVVTSESDDAQVDDAKVMTQLSNDTSNDDTSTKNVAVTKEILQETDLSTAEIESHAPCISEGEKLIVQVKSTDDKSADQKPTEEDMSCNLTNEASKEGESDQNKMTLEQEGLENERSVEDNFNTTGEEVSHENSTSGETTTELETSNNDELKSTSYLNSSISKEEETNVNEGERSVTTSEDHEVPLENTLSESRGGVECQSKTLEDAATDYSDPNLGEKSEECPIVPVEDSQIECDEHLEEESERLPVTEVPTGGTNDNVPAATDNVKNEDEVPKDAELSEIEQSTRCTSAKEDEEIESPAETLHVASENDEVPDLSQENSIEGPSEEQSRNATPHGNTIEAEEATSNAADRQTESLESVPPIVSSSHEEGSLNEVLQEATSDHMNEKIIDEDDKHKEVLENLSSGEAHCEVNDTSPDVSKGTENTDQTMKDGTDTLLPGPKPTEFASNEETYVEEIQQNAEESDSTEKVVVPEQCTKDTEIDDREMDDEKVVTQLSKDTSSDQHGSNVSSIENFALTEEIIQETDIPSEETESHAPCISEGEKLNVEVKTTDNKSADEKPAKVDMPCILTNEVSKEGASDQNEITSENERSIEEKFNTVAEEATHENSTSAETTTAPETSSNDELQSKSGLNLSVSKEEETTVQEGERSVTPSGNYGVPLDNTLSESYGDVEYQSKILEDAPTDHNDPKLAEKSKESSTIQIEDSQIECNEHLEEESERLPQTEEVSMGGTIENVPAATGNVKDDDEVHKEDELSESEQSTRCTLVKEDVEIENPAESLPFENIEVSNLSQENNTKVIPEEQSTNATVHGNTIEAEEASIDSTDAQKDDHESIPPIVSGSLEGGNMNAVLQEVTSDHTDEKIIYEVDKHEEVIENPSTTASTMDTEGNSLSKLGSSENIRGDESVKDCEPLPQDLAREVSDVSPVSHKVQSEDGELKTAELCDNESMLLKTESITENTEAEHVNSKDTKATDLVDKVSEGGTVDATGEKEETLENVPTIVPNEKMEENSHIQVDDQKKENEELLDKENEQVSNNDEEIVKDGSKLEDESASGTELFVNDRNAESVLLTEEVESENRVESSPAPHEDVKTSDFGQNTEETGILEEQIPAEKSQGIPSDKTEETAIDAANTDEKTQELQNVLNENCDRDFPVEVDAPEMKHDTNLEEEPERPSLIEASNEKVELPNDEKSTECTTPKKESLQPEDHTTSTSSADIETPCSLEGQTLAQDSQTIISDKTTDAADEKEAALENVVMETTHEHIEDNSVTQVDCPEREQEEHLDNDDQNSSLTEAPEGTDATESTNVDELKNRGEDSIKPELENEENTESTTMKEETDVEKPIDSLQVKPEDIKQHDSNSDINNSIEEQISNTDSPKISIDDAQRESVDATHTNEEIVEIKDVTKEIPDCGKEDSIQIEEVGSQNPMNEALAGNENDDESIKITESCLIKEEEPLDSLQVEAQDIETPPLCQDRETSSPYEQSPIANTEEIVDDNKEEIADSVTGVECEFPNDKQSIADCSQLEKNKGMGNESENVPPTEAPAVSSTEDEKVETPIEEQIPTADPQETCYETEEKIVDAASLNNDVVISVPNGDNEDNSLLEVDGLQEPSSEEIPATTEEKSNDDEPTTAHEAKFANENAVKANSFDDEEKEESVLVKEEVHVESLQVADEDKKDTSSGEDREASLEEQVPTTDSCGTMDDQKDAKALDLTDTKEETLEDKNYATTPSEDTKEDSLLEQKENSEKDSKSTLSADSPNSDITESTLVRERAEAEDPIESSQLETECVQDTAKSVQHEDDSPNEQNSEATLMKEDVSIDLPQVAAADTKEPCLSEVRETSSQEEQLLSASRGVLINDNEGNKAIAPTVFQTETPKDEDLTAEKLPCTEDLNVNKDITGHIPEVSNYKQQESSIMEVSEEHIVTSNQNASDSASMESEVSEKNNDPVVGEEDSCDDKTDSEKIEVLNDGSTAVTTSETLEETDPRGCTETEIQVPNEEKEAKITEQVAENDQKNIQETLPSYASEDVSESREMNDEEEIDPNSCKEISSSPISEASGETWETREEVETEDQKQESTLQVSELIEDSSVEKIEKDAHLPLASANDSGITEEKQMLKDVRLPAPEEKMIETTDCKDGDVVEGGATNDESIDHQEQDETTRSFSYDKKPTEKEQETVVDVIPSASFTEISGEDHSPAETELTNREEPCTGKTATGDDEEKNVKCNEDDKETYEASMEGILVNESSVTDLETKNDGEALEIKEATPSLAEGQDAKSVNVEETSNCAGSLTEKSESNEVAITPGENKSGYESNNQGLESIAQVQSCDIISKTGEENRKAEAETQFDKAVAEDILPEETTCEKEIMKDDISSEKEQLPRINKEDEEITEYHQGSCEDEVITDRHQEDKVNQDQQINSKETDEYTKKGNETQTVAEVSKETDEKAPEGQEEKVVTNEATARIIHQEQLATSIEEDTTKIDKEKAHELDSACVKSDTQDTSEEGVQIAIIPGKETEEQKKKDEICSSDEVQAKDEEKLMLSEGKSEEEAKETCEEACVEAEKLDFSFPTKDICAISDGAPNTSENNTNSKTEVKFSEEDCPNKSTECEVSSASEDIALTEQESEDTTVTAELQEAKAGIDLRAAVPEATGLESQEVEVLDDKCTEMADTSAPMESPVVSTPKITLEHKEEQETKPVHVGGLGSVDVTELEASPRSLKDKHVDQEAADTRNMNPENLDGNKNISTELSQGEHEIVKPSKVEQECRNEEKMDEEMEGKPASEETEKPLLSDLLRVSNTTRETSQTADHSPTEKEPSRHIEDLHAENTDEPEHENSKTDDEDESHEQGQSDLSSEAPVMVDMGDADVKVIPKKSHNILSGVGSKMKHSIAKVKKAITGKSSQPKTPSPKKATS